MRLGGRLALLATVLAAGTAAAAPSTNIADYALVAGESLIARRLVVQGGDIGVNEGFIRSHNEIDGASSRIAADLVDIDGRSRCTELAANDVVEVPFADQWQVTDRTVTPNIRRGGIGLEVCGADGDDPSGRQSGRFRKSGRHGERSATARRWASRTKRALVVGGVGIDPTTSAL